MTLFAGADLHLTPTIWKDMPSLHGDSYAALDQIVDACILGGKQSALLLLGDIFDKPKPDSESVERFRQAMDKLRSHGVEVFVIQGQHEKATPPWAVALGAAKYVGDGVPFVFNNGWTKGKKQGYQKVSIVGFDHSRGDDFVKRVKAVKKIDIMLVHQMAKQAMDISWDFDLDWVKKGVKLVLAGDYHEYLNTGRLCYPGATHMRKIDEVGPKYFLRINTADGLEVEPIPLAQRQVIEVRVLNDDQLTEAVATITDTDIEDDKPEGIETPLVIARYSPNVKDAVARIEQACQGREFLLRLKSLTGDDETTETVLPQADVTLQACLDALVNREQDEELHDFVSALLRSPEPRTVLEETKQRLGIGG